MIVSLEEMKQYLRVDFNDDDKLIENMIIASEKLCMDIVRIEDKTSFSEIENAKLAVMYAVSFQYEHREEAEHKELILNLRSVLFGSRKAEF